VRFRFLTDENFDNRILAGLRRRQPEDWDKQVLYLPL
jgi:hypothetical protein